MATVAPDGPVYQAGTLSGNPLAMAAGRTILDLLSEPGDIFYLEVPEILGFIQGYSTTTDLKGLVALRRQQYAGYSEQPEPDERFETRGIVNHGEEYRNNNAEQVAKIRRIVEDLSLDVATPTEARQMLALKGGDNVGF